MIAGKLSCREASNDFRVYLQIIPWTASSSTVAKGASFHTQDDSQQPPDLKNNPGSNKRKNRSSKGGVKQQRRRKTSDSEEDSHERKRSCQACGYAYFLKDCYYVFPELAPSTWKPKEDVQKAVKQALLKDHSLKELVAKIRIGMATKKQD